MVREKIELRKHFLFDLRVCLGFFVFLMASMLGSMELAGVLEDNTLKIEIFKFSMQISKKKKNFLDKKTAQNTPNLVWLNLRLRLSIEPKD
jgi:hypothetical protein